MFLSLSFFYVIAPSLPEIKLIVAGGQAGGVDGGVGQVDDLVHGDDGEIVVQAGGIEPGVLHNGNSLVLLHTIAHPVSPDYNNLHSNKHTKSKIQGEIYIENNMHGELQCQQAKIIAQAVLV